MAGPAMLRAWLQFLTKFNPSKIVKWQLRVSLSSNS